MVAEPEHEVLDVSEQQGFLPCYLAFSGPDRLLLSPQGCLLPIKQGEDDSTHPTDIRLPLRKTGQALGKRKHCSYFYFPASVKTQTAAGESPTIQGRRGLCRARSLD